jgi:hypothetical protein
VLPLRGEQIRLPQGGGEKQFLEHALLLLSMIASLDGSHQPMLPRAEKAGSSSRPLRFEEGGLHDYCAKLDFAGSRSAHHLPGVHPGDETATGQ